MAKKSLKDELIRAGIIKAGDLQQQTTTPAAGTNSLRQQLEAMGIQVPAAPTPPPAPVPPPAPSLGQRVGGAANAFGRASGAVLGGITGGIGNIAKALTTSEQRFGATLGEAAAVGLPGARRPFREAQAAQTGLDEMTAKLGEAIVAGRKAGRDTSALEQLYQRNTSEERPGDVSQIVPSSTKTPAQIAGEGLGVAADIAAFGTYGPAARGLKAGQLGKAVGVPLVAKTTAGAVLKGAAKQVPTGAGLGAAFSTASALQEGKPAEAVVSAGLKGAAVGGILSAAIGALTARKAFITPEVNQRLTEISQQVSAGTLTQQAAKDLIKKERLYPAYAVHLQDKAIEQYKRGLQVTKEKYKESADKLIPDLLDQQYWGTRKKLLEKANQGITLSGEEYQKLGELQGVIEIKGLVGRIDEMMTGFKLPGGRVSSVNVTRYKALQELKDDLLALDAFDKTKDLVANQQELRKLAASYGRELYETRKAQRTIMDNKTLSQVKKVDSAVRELLNTDPRNLTYSQINKVYHLNTGLADILNETALRKEGQSVLKLIETIAAGSGATVGAIVSGTVPGAVVAGASLAGIAALLRSTVWNTLRAVQKNNLAKRLMQQSLQELPTVINALLRGGIKEVTEFIGSGEEPTNQPPPSTPADALRGGPRSAAPSSRRLAIAGGADILRASGIRTSEVPPRTRVVSSPTGRGKNAYMDRFDVNEIFFSKAKRFPTDDEIPQIEFAIRYYESVDRGADQNNPALKVSAIQKWVANFAKTRPKIPAQSSKAKSSLGQPSVGSPYGGTYPVQTPSGVKYIQAWPDKRTDTWVAPPTARPSSLR